MTDLSEFLLARIAEDEAVALGADYMPGTPWRYDPDGNKVWDGTGWAAASHMRPATNSTTGAHIARWDPARVLAKCKADRRIVEGIRDATNGPVTEYYIGPMMTTDDVLELLALPYADHEDFREEWRA